MKSIIKLLALSFSVVMIAACGSDDPTGDMGDDGGAGGSVDVSVLAKYFDTAGGNVTVDIGDDIITITTKDLPDHKSVYYSTSNALYEDYTTADDAEFVKNPGEIAAQNVVIKIPRFPTVASTHEDVPMGPIGVAINSVTFFSAEARAPDVIEDEIKTFDRYNGHPAGDQYHYHIDPIWLTDASNKGTKAFLGFMADGFPVYGPVENDGTAITNSLLDDYHGHTGATADFPDGIYHYHVTTADKPWIIGDQFSGTPGTITN